MKINFNDINNALNYYNISDTKYINNCYKCIEDINSIKDFNKKAEEVYNILYKGKSDKINNLWNKESIIELFGKNYNPFVTNILVLLGYKLHNENMRKNGYTQKEIELYKKRVYDTLTNDIFIKKLKCVDYNSLPENTSLQKILKKQLINNKKLKIGCGKLIKTMS